MPSIVKASREQQILFGGDLLIEHISSNALVEPDQQGNRLLTLIEHKHSLEKCLKLPLSRVYAGHGQVIDSPQAGATICDGGS